MCEIALMARPANPRYSLPFKNLYLPPSAKMLFPNKVILQVLGIRTCYLWGTVFSLVHMLLLYVSHAVVDTQWVLYKCFFN